MVINKAVSLTALVQPTNHERRTKSVWTNVITNHIIWHSASYHVQIDTQFVVFYKALASYSLLVSYTDVNQWKIKASSY